MKPAAFEYYDPTNLSEALALLSKLGDSARPLAGGQSLVPMMNFRLVRPSHLVDLNRVSGLSYLRVESGELRIGAMTRQRELERSAAVATGWPLLCEAATLAAQDLEPDTDIHASAEYRREIGKVLARRVLEQATERAASNGNITNPDPKFFSM